MRRTPEETADRSGGEAVPPLWIFGYGSLIWRPDFPFAERRVGFIEGWTRRFWQSSVDHRGTPGAPGRVVTVVRAPGARCHGVAFRILAEQRAAVLAGLDHRERGGFEREHVLFRSAPARADEPGALFPALMYRATEANPNYAGDAPLEGIARQVLSSRGPSGENVEYVLELASALRAIDAVDEHVFALESLVRARLAAP